MDKTSQSTRTLSIRALLNALKWKPSKTERLPLRWDKEEAAARIDTTQRDDKK
jgi:hypothetical protein